MPVWDSPHWRDFSIRFVPRMTPDDEASIPTMPTVYGGPTVDRKSTAPMACTCSMLRVTLVSMAVAAIGTLILFLGGFIAWAMAGIIAGLLLSWAHP